MKSVTNDQFRERRVTVTSHSRPPDISPEQWEAERDEVATVLVRVLLRARERLIREGKLKP